jgi:hypothetical protein
MCCIARQHADASHPAGLLRARYHRPRCRAAEQRDEFAASIKKMTGRDILPIALFPA